MNIESLLDQIEDIIEAGSKVPLSSKIGVDANAIRAAIEDIRLNLPSEITQARAILADRNNILVKAKNEAVNAVTSAQEKSRALIATAEDKVRDLVLKTEEYSKNNPDDKWTVRLRNFKTAMPAILDSVQHSNKNEISKSDQNTAEEETIASV